MGGSLVLPALRERGRAGSDLRHRIDHPGRLVPPDPERGRGITVGRARPARPDGISIGVRGDLDPPDRARIQPHLQYVVTREQSVIQIKVVLLIALLALARKFIVLDLHEVAAGELLGLAAITLALGIVYWLMRERDDRLARV